MNHILLKKIEALEAEKKKLMDLVSKCSVAQQQFRPSEYEWSMLDVIEHLVGAERGTNLFFRKYPPKEATRTMGFKNYFYSALTQVALISPFKFPAPAKLKPPQGDVTLKEWEVKWQKERTILKEMLADLPEEKMKFSVFKHPRSGPMDIVNVIAFLKNHVKHHIYQINRIKKSKGFPKE
ncbi:MAG: DinB family protein [Saprospiraceae bacterium]